MGPGPAPAAGPSGNCSPPLRSVQSHFALCSRVPQVTTPVGTCPAAAPTPRSFSLPPSCQDFWKVGAGASTSRTVFRGAGLGSTNVWSLSCRLSGTGNGLTQLVGRWGFCQEELHPHSPHLCRTSSRAPAQILTHPSSAAFPKWETEAWGHTSGPQLQALVV